MKDLDLLLFISSPVWWFILMITFTMLFHDARAGCALAIMIQGFYFISLVRRMNRL